MEYLNDQKKYIVVFVYLSRLAVIKTNYFQPKTFLEFIKNLWIYDDFFKCDL